MKLKLEENCVFINGGSWKAREYSVSGYPVLKVSNFNKDSISYNELSYLQESSFEKYKKNQLRHYDVVIATVGSHPSLINSAAGRSLVIPKAAEGLLLNQNAVCLRTKNKDVIDQKYLGYLCKSQLFEHYIQQRGKGAANQMRIPIGGIKSFQFNFPKIQIQRKTASILSAYDDLIENNLKRIELFCDLAETKFMSLYNGSENWVKIELNEISEYFGRGVTPIYEEGTGVYGINQKANKGLTLNKEVFKEYKRGDWIPEEKFATKGDLLINSLGEGTIGRVHYYMGKNNKYPIDQHISIFRAKNMAVGLFVYQFFNSEYGQGHLHTLKKGGTNMTMLNIGDLRKIRIKIPSNDILENHYKSVINLFKSKAILEEQNELLKEARDILLPRLMTGMIDVEKMDLEEIKEQPLGMVAEDEINYSREK